MKTTESVVYHNRPKRIELYIVSRNLFALSSLTTLLRFLNVNFANKMISLFSFVRVFLLRDSHTVEHLMESDESCTIPVYTLGASFSRI